MKKITLTFFFLVGVLFSAFSQVQVGSGTNTSQNLPINPGSNFTYSQSIYLASEINASGQVTAINWYYNGNTALSNSQQLVIYMGTTTKASFTSSYDWISVSSLTQVYSGGIITQSTPGWKKIVLDNPFTYDGVNNLVIA